MSTIEINFEQHGTRRCGDCQLCCKLVPVKEIGKRSNTRCEHQKHGVGCTVYHKAGFPNSCALWSCRWLVGKDAEQLRRPDRSRYVLDIMPDVVTLQPNDGSVPTQIEVVQVWCDAKHRDAWRDPALLAYLERRGAEGVAAIIRWTGSDGMVVIPPSMAADGQWHEERGSQHPERSPAQQAEALTNVRKVKFV